MRVCPCTQVTDMYVKYNQFQCLNALAVTYAWDMCDKAREFNFVQRNQRGFLEEEKKNRIIFQRIELELNLERQYKLIQCGEKVIRGKILDGKIV